MAEIMTAREAVEKYIHTGTQVCWGGFSYTRRPYTIAREVIRQRDRIKHHFCTMNGGASIEEALAANDLISKLETTYVGLEGIQPVANSIRRRVQDGSIPLFEDYSNYGYATRTIAGRFGWPFAPLMAELGSDVPVHDVFGKAGLRGRNDDGSWIDPRIPPKKLAFIDDPFDGWGLRPHAFEGGDTTANKTNAVDRVRESDKYTGQKGVKVILVPPLLPEVTVIRAQRVAQDGTVRMEGINGPDAEQAMCAKILIVECEQIVPSDELRAAPELNHLPAHQTTVIVEQPFGGYPSAVPNYYDYDWDWWVSYGRLNRKSKEEVRDWWTQHVVETEDDWDYLQRIVGMKRLFELRATPAYGYRADLKRPM